MRLRSHSTGGMEHKGIPSRGFSAEDRLFLAGGRERGIHSSAQWLRRQIPALNLVAVREKESDKLDDLVRQIENTQHRCRVLEPSKVINHSKSNEVHAYLLEPSTLPKLPKSVASDSTPKIVLQGESLEKIDGLNNHVELFSTEYFPFLKSVARALQLMPVTVVSPNEKQAERLRQLIEATDVYFYLSSMGTEQFRRRSQSATINASAIVYVEDTNEEEKGDFPEELLSMIANREIIAPLIYFKPSKFWRDHNLNKILTKGLFDFVIGDISEYLKKSKRINGNSHDLVITLDKITNAVHSAIRAADKAGTFDERELSRKQSPYVFVHARRHLAEKYVANMVLNGMNAMHLHLKGERNTVNDEKVIRESITLAESWKPNILYIELHKSKKSKRRKISLRPLRQFRKRFPDMPIIVGYNPHEIRAKMLEKEPFSGVYLLQNPTEVSVGRSARSIWKEIETEIPFVLKKDETEIIRDLQPQDLESKLCTRFIFEEEPELVYQAEPVFPGAASGKVFDDIDKAKKAKRDNQPVLFYLDDITTLNFSRVKDMKKFDGIIMRKVNNENHFTIDLKRSGIPIVQIDELLIGIKEYTIGNISFSSDENISIDGSTGRIYRGEHKIVKSQTAPRELIGDISSKEKIPRFLGVVNEFLRKFNKEITINADTAEDINESHRFGVKSVGLVRTENIIGATRENLMDYGKFLGVLWSILQREDTDAEQIKSDDFYTKIRNEFVDSQKRAFTKIIEAQKGMRTQIRLLDPPIYDMFTDLDVIQIKAQLKEINGDFPLNVEAFHATIDARQGPRGAQLVREFPQIYEAQLQAIYEACDAYKEKTGRDADVRVFIPYVDEKHQVAKVKDLSDTLSKKFEGRMHLQLGVTLETPAGCLQAPYMMTELGIKNFALGTNDLLPLIDGTSDRHAAGTVYTRVSQDGTPLLSEGIITFLRETFERIEEAAESHNIEYNIGICGEMNEIKLHPENLGQFIMRADYFSVGRPSQIYSIKLNLAQSCISIQEKSAHLPG